MNVHSAPAPNTPPVCCTSGRMRRHAANPALTMEEVSALAARVRAGDAVALFATHDAAYDAAFAMAEAGEAAQSFSKLAKRRARASLSSVINVAKMPAV